MRNKLTSQTYEELYQYLFEAKCWFESLRFPTNGNRFGMIFNNVDLARQHYDKPTLSDVLRNHSMLELWVSLLDAGSFVSIYQEFRKLQSSQLPRRRLRETLSGPLLPHDEEQDGASIHARDALFEMELAARLQSRGVKLLSFDDIEFEFSGTLINVQCKRLHSSSSFQQNLDKACSQIAARINDTDKRGLVAIGIDKILGADKNIWTIADEPSLINASKSIIDQFISENERRFKKILDIRILGIIADLRFIAKVEHHNSLLTRGYETALFPLCSAATLQFVDADFLGRLAKTITDSPKPFHQLLPGT